MKIEIDLSQYFEGNFEDRITSAVVMQLTNYVSEEAYNKLAKEVVVQIRESVQSRVDSEIAARLAAPIQKVNTWGEPSGETTTLAELVAERWEKSLREPDQRSYGAKLPLLHDLIAKYALTGLQQEAEKALKSLNEEAKQQVHAAIKEIVANQLARQLK